MKYVPTIAGVILGLLFVMSAVVVLFNLIPPEKMPKPPTPEAEAFMKALGPTGYMTFIKCCELLGGILVAIPRTRNFGLLVLGPIIINILAYHTFLTNREGLRDPMLISIVVLALYLLWVGRKAFAGLLGETRDQHTIRYQQRQQFTHAALVAAVIHHERFRLVGLRLRLGNRRLVGGYRLCRLAIAAQV